MASEASAHTFAPPQNTGMSVLDRSKFNVTVPLVAAEIADVRMLSRIIKEASKKDLFDFDKFPTVIVMGEKREKRGILLAPRLQDPQTVHTELDPRTLELLKEAKATFTNWNLEIGYDRWTADQILRSILPPELGDPPTGFAVVGHIAHVNLNSEFLPYKHLIGEVILDKNKPGVKTVVNKLDSINTVYRTFDMEVLAGIPEFTVTQPESGCRFEFDFRKVYWNSRLHSEHARLVELFGEGQAICDPMAGVGPFAIPSAKRGNIVFANDLNPESYHAMNHNVKLNKLNPEAIQTFNEDGREFIRKSVERLHAFRKTHEEVAVTQPRRQQSQQSQQQPQQPQPQSDETSARPEQGPPVKRRNAAPKTVKVPETFSHYVMNLPASAIEFLDGFRGLYNGLTFSTPDPPLPIIHVHCFYKFEMGNEPPRAVVQQSISERVSKALGFVMKPEDISLFDVRRVAPSKDMYEVSFKLPKEVAYAK